VDASYLGGGCIGFAATVPDIRITWNGGGGFLRFYFIPGAAGDTALVINNAVGEWLCNDDSFDTVNPTVDYAAAPSGTYDIWVASYNRGDSIDGILYVTELDFNHP